MWRAKHHFRVTIFGSARIKRSSPVYKHIYALSKMIGHANMDIVTGGGPGIMEAANKGHKDGSKHNPSRSIGLNIQLPHEQMANRHLDIKREFQTFSGRLDEFLYLSNVVVVAPGGVGTMLELLYTWQHVQVRKSRFIPIILMGDMWEHFLVFVRAWQVKNGFIAPEEMACISVAKDSIEAFSKIQELHAQYLKTHAKRHHPTYMPPFRRDEYYREFSRSRAGSRQAPASRGLTSGRR